MAFPQYSSDTVVDITTYTFTTIAEIAQEFSNKALEQRTDDLDVVDINYDSNNPSDTTEANYWTTICQRVTSEIMSFLAPRYSAATLSTIPRIREIATYWACYKLSKRRGNPSLYEEEYLDAKEELELYRSGDRYLDAPSNGPRAYLQSSVVDVRFTRQPVRIIRAASSSMIANQAESVYAPFWWL